MKSPFPGMDPYLEEHWGDVHTRLATYASDQLNRHLPAGLRARIEESVSVEGDDGDEAAGGVYYPDVQVRRTGRVGEPRRPASSQTVAEPLLVTRPIEPKTRRSVRIVTADGSRLVTAIEFLSPSNKVGKSARKEYLDKQRDVLRSGASLVEIDLIRAGRHVAAVALSRLPPEHRDQSKVVVVRGWKRTQAEVYPLPLRAPLPAVRIPLRKADPDAALDLQALIDLAYENGGYDATDYRAPPDPDLDPDDEAWADALLKAAGKR